jgi:hypothetical protein
MNTHPTYRISQVIAASDEYTAPIFRAPSASRLEVCKTDVPAPIQHRNFMAAYYKAARSSLPQDWFDAALMAKQWENEITGGALDDEFRFAAIAATAATGGAS